VGRARDEGDGPVRQSADLCRAQRKEIAQRPGSLRFVLPGGHGLGLEPDLKPLANPRSLHIERHA
jgi:hypothetical protein